MPETRAATGFSEGIDCIPFGMLPDSGFQSRMIGDIDLGIRILGVDRFFDGANDLNIRTPASLIAD